MTRFFVNVFVETVSDETTNALGDLFNDMVLICQKKCNQMSTMFIAQINRRSIRNNCYGGNLRQLFYQIYNLSINVE